MKKIVPAVVSRKIVLALFLMVLLLTACAPAAQGFVQLPDATRVAITALVVAVLGLLFAKIGSLFPWSVPFITKYKEEISLALAAASVGVIENALPSAYPEPSILFVNLVLSVLAAIGLFKVFAKSGVKGFRS